MKSEPGYSVWRDLDYQPAIPMLDFEPLVSYLQGTRTALDVGCNTGTTSLFLAKQGIEVLGIDINANAIHVAQEHATEYRLNHLARFQEVNVLESSDLGLFDLVLLIRILTCFPVTSERQRLLSYAYRQLKPGGLLYVHDFILSPELSNYEKRYLEGLRRGYQPGDFPVCGPSGNLLFVAHHHSQEEIQEIMTPYVQLYFQVHLSLSMNGNKCKMFQFIGRTRGFEEFRLSGAP